MVVCALLCLGACRTLPPAPVESTGPAGAYSRQSILVGEQAFLTSDAFYIRFRRGDQLVHGGGEWSNRIDLQDYPDTNPSGDMFILPLQFEQAGPWPAVPATAHPITILGIAQWREFRNRLLEHLLPDGEKEGLVVRFSEDDYFLYRNGEGVFRAVLLQKKPGDYRVAETIASSELVRRGFPLLRDFLREQHVEQERVAFNTGDAGPYSLPFVYVNTRLQIPVFIRLEPSPSGYATSNRALAMMRTGYHIIRSHLTGVAFHPVSSLYRLFFYSTDTLAETIRPDWLIPLTGRPPPPLKHSGGMDLDAWEKRLDSLTGRPASRGTMDFLVGGEAFFIRFADAVTSAQKSVSLRMYIFDDDDYAVKIADMLKARSNAGADVRVLLDGLGMTVSSMEKQPSLPASHRPPFSMKRYLAKDSRIGVRLSDNPWMTGDHIKTVVIDGRRAFLGGMNIAREYRYDWHDMMVELNGDIVAGIEEDFEKAWAYVLPSAMPSRIFSWRTPISPMMPCFVNWSWRASGALTCVSSCPW